MTQQLANHKEPPRKTITKKTHLEITVQGQRSTFYQSFKECFRKREIKNAKETNKTDTKNQTKNPNNPQQTHQKNPSVQPSKKPQNQQKHNTQSAGFRTTLENPHPFQDLSEFFHTNTVVVCWCSPSHTSILHTVILPKDKQRIKGFH